jgi:hypothetical protein
MKRPHRVSIGRYAVYPEGQTVILQRCGRSGFKIITRPGAISPMFKRLREAVAIAMDSANPWPFDVPRPDSLRRTV